VTRLLAPAKLTVSLAVTGVRGDGFHELEAEMVSLDLVDELTITEPGHGVRVQAAPGSRAEGLDVGPSNLIVRALAATGRTAAVDVVKRIPLGGGLGGGSADAGAVLRWAGCTDVAVAATLGADVPFCVRGGRARVEGIGDRLTPLPFERRTFLLCIPPFGVNTAQVYAAWDTDPSYELPNALTAPALRVEPRLAAWRAALADYSGGAPVLAGSGSTWFVETTDVRQGAATSAWLEREGQSARLVRATTVPPEWDGS
jgi:4-diphosphocytidyl-2-C-methyl-D-erythritol kinase